MDVYPIFIHNLVIKGSEAFGEVLCSESDNFIVKLIHYRIYQITRKSPTA